MLSTVILRRETSLGWRRNTLLHSFVLKKKSLVFLHVGVGPGIGTSAFCFASLGLRITHPAFAAVVVWCR